MYYQSQAISSENQSNINGEAKFADQRVETEVEVEMEARNCRVFKAA